MRQQWDTFERVENYNDVIYQYLQIGVRNKSYYVQCAVGECYSAHKCFATRDCVL